jgi:poly(3-hydroxybutyrate) depolymerase
MVKLTRISPDELKHLAVPLLWPMAAAAQMAEAGLELYGRNFRFVDEELRINQSPPPELATPNRVGLDLRTMRLRDYSTAGATGLPTIVLAPYAGHTAAIADLHHDQSLMETLLAHGLQRLFLTDWKAATEDMKDLEIDQYLADLNVCVGELGDRVNLVGLCQGGWLSAMYAARFPHKVAKLVLAGAPIDFEAGDGPVRRMAHTYPTSFYQELVVLGGGLMRGRIMLRGWKDMHPEQHYFQQHLDLYEHIDDPVYLRKVETFKRWYENPIDLPGRWYMQVITQLFKENRLVEGTFVALGRPLKLGDIRCPVYLLAGAADDITTREQVFNAERHLGTPKDAILKLMVPGGHIGLFMGSRSLARTWPAIARWIAER